MNVADDDEINMNSSQDISNIVFFLTFLKYEIHILVLQLGTYTTYSVILISHNTYCS